MPFKKGDPGGPGAHQKGMRISDWLNAELERIGSYRDATTIAEYEEHITKRQILAKKMVDTALASKDPVVRLSYFKELADRTEGRPTQPIDHTSKGERIFDNLTDEQLAAIATGGADAEGEGEDRAR